MAASTPGSNKEHLYKILVIGEFGVGKTSIIRRYTEGTFSPNYKLTIGVDFALKSLVWDENTKVNMQLWDIAGHERFGHMTRVYYKYAIGAIIVFDLSRPATFDSVLKVNVTGDYILTVVEVDPARATPHRRDWLNDVNSKVMLANEQPVPVMLLANKCDMEGVEPDTHKIDKFCKEHQFIGWFPTSAKSDTNVSEAVRYLVKHILQLPSESQQPTEHITLTEDNNTSHYDDSFETEESYNKRTNKPSGCCS